MPRLARLILPGVAVHIVQRGNNRSECFKAESDYLIYLLHLRELATKHGAAVHAYCLMTNHVHLLVTPERESSCTQLMRDLGQRYVQYFNRRHGRSGTLWEGRFRSCLVESALYVLGCYRYIEFNPVRASMVAHPGDYAWSSHRATAGARDEPLLSPHVEYSALGETAETRRVAYAGMFEQALEPSLLESIRSMTRGGYPLVSESFKARLSMKRTEPGRAGRPSATRRSDSCDASEIGL